MMKRFFIFVCFGALSLSAQDHVEALALKYPFLDTAKNHIQYYGNEDALEGFFTKLDKAIFEYEGKVNVVHMGGSRARRYVEPYHADEPGPAGTGAQRGAWVLFPAPFGQHQHAAQHLYQQDW